MGILNRLHLWLLHRNRVCRSEALDARFADESLCTRCGVCCFAGTWFEGRPVMLPDLPCRWLMRDGVGRFRCQVYPERLSVNDRCRKVDFRSVEEGIFAQDCPYVAGLGGYRGKGEIGEEARSRFDGELRRRFGGRPRPAYATEEGWAAFQRRLGAGRG